MCASIESSDLLVKSPVRMTDLQNRKALLGVGNFTVADFNQVLGHLSGNILVRMAPQRRKTHPKNQPKMKKFI